MINMINWNNELMPYQQALTEIIAKFNALKDSYNNMDISSPIESVRGRVKTVNSILDKAKRKNIDVDKVWLRIDDIVGIRIICRFVQDIEVVVEHIRSRSELDMEIVEEKDYVNNTKDSGYRSYHMIIHYKVATPDGVKKIACEIQIRTMSMDFWATIEHSLKYKYNSNLPEILKTRLVSAAEAAFTLDMEMGHIRHEILEVQEVRHQKDVLVQEILNNLQRLYYEEKVDIANEFNTKFFAIYERGDIQELKKFNEQMRIVTQIYRG